jgi:hypothetical protein
LLEAFLPFNAIFCTSPRTLHRDYPTVPNNTNTKHTTKTQLLFWYTDDIKHEPTNLPTSDYTTTHYVQLSEYPTAPTNQRVAPRWQLWTKQIMKNVLFLKR